MIKKAFFLLTMLFFLSTGMSGQVDLNNPPTNDQAASGDVIINGTPLSTEQITEMEQAYGAKPLPGNYWYDKYSGLYGAVGYPSFGFMMAGDEFGELKTNASNGDSPVFVNGRQFLVYPFQRW